MILGRGIMVAIKYGMLWWAGDGFIRFDYLLYNFLVRSQNAILGLNWSSNWWIIGYQHMSGFKKSYSILWVTNFGVLRKESRKSDYFKAFRNPIFLYLQVPGSIVELPCCLFAQRFRLFAHVWHLCLNPESFTCLELHPDVVRSTAIQTSTYWQKNRDFRACYGSKKL